MVTIDESEYLRPDRHRLISPNIPSSIAPFQFEFSSIKDKELPMINTEFEWFIQTEFSIGLQDIGQLLTFCQSQLHLESTGVEPKALFIPELSGEYVTGTLHIEGESVSRADLMIRLSPKSGSKNRVYAGLKGFSNCWKLNQLTDVSNQFKRLMDRFFHLLHRQDLHQLSPYHLSILISDIICSLQKCINIFEIPKRPNLRDIQQKQIVFKPPLPEEFIINIFLSSFHLIITVFYLSTSQHRYQLQNAKPIVSLTQQESFINIVLEGAGGKEYEVVYQGEGSCQVPSIKCMISTIITALKYSQALLDRIECFSDV